MAIFSFFSWVLVTVVVATLIWPFNIPLAALAYKVKMGYQPIPLERSAFWWRSTFVSLALFGLTLAALVLAFVLVERAEMPPGPIHIALLAAYVPAGVGLFFWLYAMEDLIDALGVFTLYIVLSGLPLMLIGKMAGLWQKWAADYVWILGS